MDYRKAVCLCAVATSAILALAADPASALSLSTNVAFNKVNQNPWADANHFSEKWENRDIRFSGGFNIPNTGLTPGSVLRDLLGLPGIDFGSVRGAVNGSGGLTLGYAVDGGRMNIQAPGRATLNINTVTPGTHAVVAGQSAATSTQFDPGLTRTFAGGSGLQMIGGGGYDAANSIAGAPVTLFSQPVFQTYFPTASAWANLDYDVSAGITASAGIRGIGPIPDLVLSKSFNTRKAGTVELVNVNPDGVQVFGQERIGVFGQPYGTPAGDVVLHYPDVGVTGAAAPGSIVMRGSSAKPIIELDAHLEQLVPVLGQFLRQQLGPFDVKLLAIDGGPTLNLYQDFTVELIPQVTLRFSQTVGLVRNGITSFVDSVSGAIGETFDWFPVLGTTGDIRVQTTYTPTVRIRNQTGFALGYDLDVDALGIDTALGDVGPFNLVNVRQPDVLRLGAFFDETFESRMAPIALRDITLGVVGSAIQEALAAPINFLSAVNTGGNQFRLDFALAGSNTVFSALATGSTKERGNADHRERFLTADGDVMVNIMVRDINSDTGFRPVQINVGRFFCIQCRDHSGQFDAESPYFFDGADQLYITDLTSFRRDDVDGSANPDINRVAQHIVLADEVNIGPTVRAPVPEPATWGLMIVGFGVAGAMVRRRRAAGAA